MRRLASALFVLALVAAKAASKSEIGALKVMLRSEGVGVGTAKLSTTTVSPQVAKNDDDTEETEELSDLPQPESKYRDCKQAIKELGISATRCKPGSEHATTPDARCAKDCKSDDFAEHSSACCQRARPSLAGLRVRTTMVWDNEGRVPKNVWREGAKGGVVNPGGNRTTARAIGAMADVFFKFANDSGIQVVFRELSTQAKRYSKQQHTACVRDIELNNTDVCVGSFTETQDRASRSLFAPAVWKKNFYLLTVPTIHETESRSLQESLTYTFQPFTWQLWLLCGIVTIVTSLTYAYLEMDTNEEDFDALSELVPDWVEKIWDSVYLSFQGFFGIAVINKPQTDAGRCVLLGFGFFVLITVCHYTAALTVGKMQAGVVHQYTGLDHCIANGGRICIDRDIPFLMERLQLQTHLLIEDVNLLRFSGETAKAMAYKSGKCDAIVDIADSPKFKKQPYCGFMPVGTTLFESLRSIPVRTAELDTALSFWLLQYIRKGELDTIRNKYVPVDECSRHGFENGGGSGEVEEQTAYSTDDMMGAFFVWALLVVFCLVMHLTCWFLDKNRASKRRLLSQKKGTGQPATSTDM